MSSNDNSVTRAVATICQVIRSDKGYREAWQANIAMAFVDNATWYKKRHDKKTLSNTDLHKVANEAANYFLDLLTSQKGKINNYE